jgi:mxaA protein
LLFAAEDGMKRLLIPFLLVVGCSGSIQDPVSYFKVETPRPFGYVIGDEIPQRIILETREDIALQPGSLPAEGPINRWLNLNEIAVKKTGPHYEIDLRYQVFYAPLEVKMLTIPGFNVLFKQGGETLSHAVPAWSFTLSPLRELAVRKEGKSEYMRPDAAPSRLPNTRPLYGLGLSLLAMLAIGICLGYLYGCFPKLARRTVFKRALRELKKLTNADMEQALGIVHRALNGLNRQPLFHNQLHRFYRRYPEYRRLAPELEWFFNYSNRYFFTSGARVIDYDLERLMNLCEQCRQIERGG